VSNARRIRERGRGGAARPKGQRAAGPAWRDDYWFLSTRPLHALFFLLPLVALYELGTILYMPSSSRSAERPLLAERLLGVVFEHFGVFGLLVPGFALIAVLVMWHIVAKDRWIVRPMVVLAMYLESATWVLPLLVMAAVITDTTRRFVAALPQNTWLRHEPWEVRATISLGAGIFEELLFRLAGMNLIHFLLKDVLGVRPLAAAITAVITTSLAFAAFHPGIVDFTTLWPWTWHIRNGAGFMFLVLSGVYFACVYLQRGFGIAVGAHACYDLAVLVLFPQPGA
jgi:hypothetical protein